MSDKKYHSSQPSLKHFGGGCVSGLCGTWKYNRKETDEMNTMNNCSATHLSHLNVHIQNENKHHNFDQAFESTATWRQALLWLYSAKIKILFLLCMTLFSFIEQRTKYYRSFIRREKRNYQRRLSISRVKLLFLGVVLQQMSAITALSQSHFVHWNTSNPIFRIDNTDHIIDVNHGNKPWEYDQVNIICPVYPPGKNYQSDIEKYIIYSVSKEEYQSCRITTPNPRVIAICNKPHELMYFTITFRSFTPTPGGMEFKPGRNYYFISTSSKDDLYRRVGGHCSTNHMKVQFKIADNNYEMHPSKTPTAINVPRRRKPLGPYPRPRPSILTEGDGETVIINTPRNYKYKEFPYYNGNPHSQDERELSYQTYDNNGHITPYFEHSYYPHDTRGNEKKRNEYDIHPNDVIKHEASRMAAAASSATPNYCTHCNANKMVFFTAVVSHMIFCVYVYTENNLFVH